MEMAQQVAAVFGSGCTYIVRPDLDCYIKIDNVERRKFGTVGPTFSPLKLHGSFSDVQYYFGVYHNQHAGIVQKDDEERECIYVINSCGKFTRVSAMEKLTEEAAKWEDLDDDCKDGKFYIATTNYKTTTAQSPGTPNIIIIRDNKLSVYSDLNTGEQPQESDYGRAVKNKDLHENCKDGEYYWASQSRFDDVTRYYIAKRVDGHYDVHCTRNLCTDEDGDDFILHLSVAQLLPGGISFEIEETWEKVPVEDTSGSATNTVDATYKTTTLQVGYNQKLEAFTSSDYVPKDWIEKFKYSFEKGSHKGLYKKMVLRNVPEQFSKLECASEAELSITLPTTVSEIFVWQQCIKMPHFHHTQSDDVAIYTPHFMTTTTDKRPIKCTFDDN